MVTKTRFGILPDGREVSLYTISNGFGESAGLLDYGAAVHSLRVKDRDGQSGDVVLGAEKAEDLLEYSFEGVTIGRCANRIAQGRYVWKGKEYQLEQNRNGHFLHGASGNYAHQLFEAEYDGDKSEVTFCLKDSGKGGFGCEADVRITFSFDDLHRLTICYEITPDGDTVISPTNHAYFNLSGQRDVRDHMLCIHAGWIAKKDAEGIPKGEIRSVGCTRMDFRKLRSIREAMEQENGPGDERPLIYDDYYLLEPQSSPAAELFAPDTGRIMRVFTDMPGLILFTPYAGKVRKGKYGEAYQGYCAICLETQHIPNAVNCAGFLKPIVLAHQTFRSRTSYEFGVIGYE